MTIVRNQQSLFNLISEKLNENSYDVEFRSDLFNSNDTGYKYRDEDGLWHRFVPVTLTDVPGERLNIPNSNTTLGSTSLTIDMFVGFEGNSDNKEDEFDGVQYDNTRYAIQEFQSALLAQYYPLGTPYLYMGGEDSTVTITTSGSYATRFVYFKVIFKNTDNENIFEGDNATTNIVYKNATDVVFQISTGITISVPYNINEETEITIYRTDTNWYITNGTDIDTVVSTTFNATNDFYIGKTTGLEAIIERFVFDNGEFTDINDVTSPALDISTWSSKDSITNSGDATLTVGTIENCILWSLDGNAIFGFGELNPLTNPRAIDGEALYQLFDLEINYVVSNDVLFGNNFEYFLSFDGGVTYEQVYPIDRTHSLGTSIEMEQYISDNYSKGLIPESGQDISLSFYYIPTKKLTKLLKHIVSGETEQNEWYKLKVQYPFFNIVYDVIVENGGTSPNINNIASFSLSLKRKDDSLT